MNFKIVLLPQGEFAEFLKQNTTQRREVLRKLFPVDLAVQIRDLAQARANDLSARLSEAEQALQEAARRCPPESVTERRTALEALQKRARNGFPGPAPAWRNLARRWGPSRRSGRPGNGWKEPSQNSGMC